MTPIPEPTLPPIRAKKQRNVFEQAAATSQESPQEEQQVEAQRNAPTAKKAPNAAAAKHERQSPKRMGGTKDILLSLPEELKDRMQATVAFTYPYTGIKHQQAFIREAITQLCMQMEGQYNNGEEWPLPADLRDS
ncbi:hypothetical protein [Rhodococcus marinonascens]|uniref:hypothetical protein n=1 Tax=Rhodococcus marinonascens TaxID=38311 RepID=UPI000B07A90F|nr:hypothetical protein [Rhodococcus marinonascens]